MASDNWGTLHLHTAPWDRPYGSTTVSVYSTTFATSRDSSSTPPSTGSWTPVPTCSLNPLPTQLPTAIDSSAEPGKTRPNPVQPDTSLYSSVMMVPQVTDSPSSASDIDSSEAGVYTEPLTAVSNATTLAEPSEAPPVGSETLRTSPPTIGYAHSSVSYPASAMVTGHAPHGSGDSQGNSDSRTNTGAIAGGIVGALAIVLLILCAAIFLRRRMRARHTAPSAEFMNMGILKRRGGPRTWYGVGCPGGITSPFKREGGTTMPGLERPTNPLASRSSLESDESPTAYTPRSYTDSVLEKAHAAGKMREYHFRLASLQLATATGASETGLMGLDGHESEGGHQHGYMMDPEKAEYASAI
ncbi:hypothetical protein ONZ51_g8839 [Trametes cubensis]|uniref:Uncharacterized protein n=1 Tax=Trametes cubensis TaxID=1111947 RepID=A0AAD7TPZ9_9APHY|nr:hypothetical protein ONZ51_g8839 [Trametes cubensis]